MSTASERIDRYLAAQIWLDALRPEGGTDHK